MLTSPRLTSSNKLSQCRERAFEQKRFQFTLENVLLESVIPELHGTGCSKLQAQHGKNSVCQTSAELSVVHNGESWQICDGFWKGYLR